MTVNLLSSRAATVAPDYRQNAFRLAMCPMCHTPASQTQSAIDAGGDWRCVRCGQHWDAQRLAAVAAYATWVVANARADRMARMRVNNDAARFPQWSPAQSTGTT